MGIKTASRQRVSITSAVAGSSYGTTIPITTVVSSTATNPSILALYSSTDSNYTSTSTAGVSTLGGFIKLIGNNFVSGCTLYVNGSAAISTTFVSSTEVRAQVNATSAGIYSVMFFNNTTQGAIYGTGLTYVYYAPPTTSTVQYLVVAGGGGASGMEGGGGGAGGLLSSSTFAITSGTRYIVTVGAGGAGLAYNATPAATNQGNNSVFASATAIGGGYGVWSGQTAGTGGSGGGGCDGGSGGAGTAGQGNAGGGSTSGSLAGAASGGGGGGAGAAGQAGTASTGGSGGTGTFTTIISTTTALSLGIGHHITATNSLYFAGGGGGGKVANAGVGGWGGGADANITGAIGNSARAYTGGGGGAVGFGSATTNPGGNGGSGVVIISYPSTYNTASATTGSGITLLNAGGYITYVFLSSGSITF